MTIGNVSISPAIAAAGDTVHVSCKVTMGSGENASLGVYLYLDNASTGSSGIMSDNRALGAGKSRSYSFSTPVWEMASSVRGEKLKLKAEAFGGGGAMFAATVPDVLTYLDAWRAPSIASLSARRFLNGAPSAVGTEPAVSLQAALKPGVASGGMTCTLSYKRVDEAQYSLPVSVPVGDALSGIADDAALLSALSMGLGSEYDVLAYFGDQFESAKQRFRITKAHTKFSVARDAPGVSVGQHSTATTENPKFECQYPAHFYGGMPQMDYSASAADTKIRWIDGQTIYRRVLPFSFSGSASTATASLGEAAVGTIVALRGTYLTTSNSAIPIPRAHDGNIANQVDLYVTNVNSYPTVGIKRGSSLANGSGCIVVEYTLP